MIILGGYLLPIGKTISRPDAMLHVFWYAYLTIAAISGVDIEFSQSIAG